MPNLGDDVLVLVCLAVAAIRHEPSVEIRVELENAWRHDPWLGQHDGVLDRNFVKDLCTLTRETLDHLQLVGVEEAAAREPRVIVEANGLDDERVALPMPRAVTRVSRLHYLSRVVLAAVGRDHTNFSVSA